MTDENIEVTVEDETTNQLSVDQTGVEEDDVEETTDPNPVEIDDDADTKEQTTASSLETEADIAADYLEEFLDIVDMDGDIDTYSEGDRAHISIVTESQALVGRNGEVLEALQELSRLAVLTETGHRSRLILDIAGHREKRRHELVLMAQEAVAEVETSGEPVRLPAMNPFERKIVHDTVAEAGLTSESEGAEPSRRVVVSPK